MNSSYTWSLDFDEAEENGFMRLYATDGEQKEYISPRGYSCACFVDDNSSWGYAISPIQFVDVAKVFQLKFSKETYENVCKRFAEKNYGDEAYEVDDFFLATGRDLLVCLL